MDIGISCASRDSGRSAELREVSLLVAAIFAAVVIVLVTVVVTIVVVTFRQRKKSLPR